MFLDDELLEICEKADIKSSKDVIETIDKVYQRCISYLDEKVESPFMSKIDILTLMNKSFKLFDLFVEKLKFAKKSEVRGFYYYFIDHTFKDMFLSTKNGKEIYEECLKYKSNSKWN